MGQGHVSKAELIASLEREQSLNALLKEAQMNEILDFVNMIAAHGSEFVSWDEFMKGVDWTDDLYQKPIPGKSAQEVMKAVDKMIVMGAEMDWPALQEAARAHVTAIERMDAKGVLTQGDFESILAGLGKAISSLPESTVMSVFSAMGKVAGQGSGIPANLYQKQDPALAMVAYNSLMKFKDAVRSAQ